MAKTKCVRLASGCKMLKSSPIECLGGSCPSVVQLLGGRLFTILKSLSFSLGHHDTVRGLSVVLFPTCLSSCLDAAHMMTMECRLDAQRRNLDSRVLNVKTLDAAPFRNRGQGKGFQVRYCAKQRRGQHASSLDTAGHTCANETDLLA